MGRRGRGTFTTHILPEHGRLHVEDVGGGETAADPFVLVDQRQLLNFVISQRLFQVENFVRFRCNENERNFTNRKKGEEKKTMASDNGFILPISLSDESLLYFHFNIQIKIFATQRPRLIRGHREIFIVNLPGLRLSMHFRFLGWQCRISRQGNEDSDSRLPGDCTRS